MPEYACSMLFDAASFSATTTSGMTVGVTPASVSQRVTLKMDGDQITRKADAAIMEVAREERRPRGASSTSQPDPASMPAPPVAPCTMRPATSQPMVGA